VAVCSKELGDKTKNGTELATTPSSESEIVKLNLTAHDCDLKRNALIHTSAFGKHRTVRCASATSTRGYSRYHCEEGVLFKFSIVHKPAFMQRRMTL